MVTEGYRRPPPQPPTLASRRLPDGCPSSAVVGATAVGHGAAKLGEHMANMCLLAANMGQHKANIDPVRAIEGRRRVKIVHLGAHMTKIRVNIAEGSGPIVAPDPTKHCILQHFVALQYVRSCCSSSVKMGQGGPTKAPKKGQVGPTELQVGPT